MKGRKGKELLSFEDTDEDPLPVKRPRLPPNPSASPLSLPDFQKSAEERQLREGLKHEFEVQQEAIKGRENLGRRAPAPVLHVLGRISEPAYAGCPQTHFDFGVSSTSTGLTGAGLPLTQESAF